jgi:polysaccharide deacetylase 2 family uncharacterized protein YibQ
MVKGPVNKIKKDEGGSIPSDTLSISNNSILLDKIKGIRENNIAPDAWSDDVEIEIEKEKRKKKYKVERYKDDMGVIRTRLQEENNTPRAMKIILFSILVLIAIFFCIAGYTIWKIFDDTTTNQIPSVTNSQTEEEKNSDETIDNAPALFEEEKTDPNDPILNEKNTDDNLFSNESLLENDESHFKTITPNNHKIEEKKLEDITIDDLNLDNNLDNSNNSLESNRPPNMPQSDDLKKMGFDFSGMGSTGEQANNTAENTNIELIPMQEGETQARTDLLPAWRKYAAKTPAINGKPMIGIILEAENINSRIIEVLKGFRFPFTIVLNADEQDIEKKGKMIREAGFEVIINVPMEAKEAVPLGKLPLLSNLSLDELMRRFDWHTSQYKEIVGFRNKYGSELTTNLDIMANLMTRTDDAGLLFIDSQATKSSIAYSAAKRIGVPTIKNDINLSDIDQAAHILKKLQEASKIAQQYKNSVATGKLTAEMLKAINSWIRNKGSNNIVVVPLSFIAKTKSEL